MIFTFCLLRIYFEDLVSLASISLIDLLDQAILLLMSIYKLLLIHLVIRCSLFILNHNLNLLASTVYI